MPPAQKDNVDSELRRVRNRELELKRITGEISCAECRRLKLKCDKKVPCSSCTRRGCKQICPTGTNTGNTGNTGRQIIINSAPLPITNDSDATCKLTAMSERIRALEDALHIHAGDECHPLLAPELLAIKQGIEVVDRTSEKNADDEAEDNLVGAFGTLTVSEGKTMRFLGATAADSVLLMEVFDPSSEGNFIVAENLPQELIQASRMWPFTPAYLSKPEHIAQIAAHLPPYERVTSLLEAYFSNLAWFIAPIDRSQVVEEVIPLFYPQRRPISPSLVESEKLHDLALLFIVFACGSVADLTQPAINPEGERFQQLARAALGMRSFLDYGSLAAAQAMMLMGSYEIYSGRKASQESSWKCVSMGMMVAVSIGLHRDPSRWKLDTKMINWRRRTFWEINSIDKWKSLGSGRPVVFPSYAIDCEHPLDRGATVEEDGVVVESVWQWRYRFSRDVLTLLAEKLCAARPPKYSDIMEMDRVVRDFELHAFVIHRPKPGYSFLTDGEYRNLHPYISVWWKEMALLYVHRNYFARAMLEYPNGPIRSPFGPSFLASYRAATTLLALVRETSIRMSLILERLWGFWAISLSCSVIVGSVACRPSTINFAASALHELERAISVFESGSNHPVARNGIKLLYRLRDKANTAFQRRESQSPPGPNTELRSSSQLQVSRLPRAPDNLLDNEEELNIIRGTTRYVEQRSMPSRRILQDNTYSQAFLTSGYPSSSTSASSSMASPNMDSYSRSASDSPSENDRSPSPTPRESLFHHVVRTRGVESLLGPSPLVQSPPEAKNGTSPSGSSGEAQNRVCHYGNHLPPIIEATGQPLNQAQVLPSSVETARAKSIFQSAESLTAHSQPEGPSAVPRVSGVHDPFTASSLPEHGQYTGMSSTGSNVASNTFNLFANIGTQQTSPPFDFTLDPTNVSNPFFSGTVPDPQLMADLNALYQKEDVNTTEAWNSFMQQFELTNTAGAGYDSWEAMVFS